LFAIAQDQPALCLIAEKGRESERFVEAPRSGDFLHRASDRKCSATHCCSLAAVGKMKMLARRARCRRAFRSE
jgi:hypothetical protein